jgi:transketolase
MTTGPLVQGLAHGVGMAVAERVLAEHYNRPGHEIVHHYTYAIVSDGDLQEGVTAEAASLAGTLKLGKLIYLYDDNDVQLASATEPGFSEKAARLFVDYGWQVIGPVDGFDVEAVDAAIREARADTGRPSLIVCKTIIGYGSPQQATSKAHGEPLSEEGAHAAKIALGWPEDPAFYLPDEVLSHTRRALERGREYEAGWEERLSAYEEAHPEEAARFQAETSGELLAGWDAGLDGLFSRNGEDVATRNA